MAANAILNNPLLLIPIVILVFVIIAAIFLKWWKSYDIRVNIMVQLAGGGIETSVDYGKIIVGKISGTRYLRLMKKKIDLPNLLDKHVAAYKGSKLFGKGYQAWLLKASNGQYYWLDPHESISFANFKPIDYNMLNWIRQGIEAAFARWNKTEGLMKYKEIIIAIILGIVIIATGYIVGKQQLEMTDKNTASLDKASAAIEHFSRSIDVANNMSARIIFYSTTPPSSTTR